MYSPYWVWNNNIFISNMKLLNQIHTIRLKRIFKLNTSINQSILILVIEKHQSNMIYCKITNHLITTKSALIINHAWQYKNLIHMGNRLVVSPNTNTLMFFYNSNLTFHIFSKTSFSHDTWTLSLSQKRDKTDPNSRMMDNLLKNSRNTGVSKSENAVANGLKLCVYVLTFKRPYVRTMSRLVM